MIVHFYLQTDEYEVNSRLAGPGPQWAAVPGIIMLHLNNLLTVISESTFK